MMKPWNQRSSNTSNTQYEHVSEFRAPTPFAHVASWPDRFDPANPQHRERTNQAQVVGDPESLSDLIVAHGIECLVTYRFAGHC